MKHHDEAIARYAEQVSDDETTLAVIVTGSLARGTERAASDVDLYLVVTAERWDAAYRDNLLMFVETEGADYPGGYFDVKLATLDYLDDAAERGDDPVRDSFAHTRIAFSRVDDLQERLDRVAAVPESTWDSHIASFLAQARLHANYFLVQGHEAGDRILTAHAAVHLVTSASRLLLAHNRVLFAGPKYLAKAVAGLPLKPAGWDRLVERVLTDPTPETSHVLLAALEDYEPWPLAKEHTLSTFILDNELAWRYRTKTPEYS
jgi:predicted nucleotidyltransferase